MESLKIPEGTSVGRTKTDGKTEFLVMREGKLISRDQGRAANRPEPSPLEARYIRMFDRMDEKAALDAYLDKLRVSGVIKLDQARKAVNAEAGKVDAGTLAGLMAAVERLQNENEQDLLAHIAGFTVYLWNKMEAAVREVRAGHGLSSDLPPGLPAVTVNMSSGAAAAAIQKRMVLELDDDMEKEVIKLLNDQYAKEKPSPDTISMPAFPGKSSSAPSTKPATDGLP